MSTQPVTRKDWQKRFFIAFTVLGWIIIAGIAVWGIGHIVGTMVLFIVAALLSYIIFPMVKLLRRILPRPLAVLLAFLLMVGILIFVLYFVVLVAVQQLIVLIGFIQAVVQHPDRYPQIQTLVDWLNQAGISTSQFNVSTQQVLAYMEGAITGIAPLLSSLFGVVINGIILASLCVYFMIDGERIIGWLRQRTPIKQRRQINFLLDLMDKSLGGYVRGQIILAVVMTTIITIGGLLVRLPYMVLVAVIVFVCEFIPMIGAYISGAIILLIALTQGWQTALIMLIFLSLVNGILEGQILSPRILGESVGLHPIISLAALLVGSQLFGVLGAVLAAPIAGILQAIIVSSWATWRASHIDQFPEEAPVNKEQPVSAD